MKKTLLTIITITAFSLMVNAQNVNIPDANFKAYLVGNSSINTNSDTEIQVSEATTFTGQINCPSLSISDLTGIEAFTALTNLNCTDNLLTTLNITQNTGLLQLSCNTNNLSTLDISQNTALLILICNYNNLATLNISQNAGLQGLNCSDNNLTVLNMKNISTTTSLTSFFFAENNNLTCIEVDDVVLATSAWTNIDTGASFSLDCGYVVNIPDANFKAYLVGNSLINTNADTEIQVSEATAFNSSIYCPSLGITDLTGIEAFPNITFLSCHLNNLSSLNTTSNTSLISLSCYNNNLTSLVLNNPNLTSIGCATNNLTSIDLSASTKIKILNLNNNSLTSLDVSAIDSLTSFYCSSNNLTSLNAASGNNTHIANFITTNNPNLTCIKVDDVAYSTTNWTAIDAGASFSLNCGFVGVNEESTAQSFSIYPNPVNSLLNIDSEEKIETIVIMDIMGKKLETIVAPNSTIDVSHLTKGIYFLQIQMDNRLVSKKFIKE